MKILCTLAVMLVYIGKGTDAIQCYDCSSASSKGCADPFNANSDGVGKLSGIGDTECKSCQKLIGEIQGSKVIVRTCSTTEISEDECIGSGNEQVCNCQENLCNKASHPVTSVAKYLMFCVVLVVLIHLI